MVEFSKYKFINKLLVGVTFLRVTSSITWTQPYIYIKVSKIPLKRSYKLLKNKNMSTKNLGQANQDQQFNMRERERERERQTILCKNKSDLNCGYIFQRGSIYSFNLGWSIVIN